MYYPNKVTIEYEGDLALEEEEFGSCLEEDFYGVIDYELLGKEIGEEMVKSYVHQISKEDIYIEIDEALTSIKESIEYFVEEWIETNTEEEIR